MLNKEKHQLIMGSILRDIYNDTSIAPLLGFKGGTCAYFFYGLPRFSVDLDFDLLSFESSIKTGIFEKVEKIVSTYGTIKNKRIKRFTLFLLLSYGNTDHNIKVEINTRDLIPHIRNHYELKEHLGISMLVGKKGYLFASKLAALTMRSQLVMRDVYDIYFFGKHQWDIDLAVLKTRTGKETREYLAECIRVIEQIPDNKILSGLGELLSEKEKAWVKARLRKEAIFVLKNYLSVMA